jgi:hypothetical protein
MSVSEDGAIQTRAFANVGGAGRSSYLAAIVRQPLFSGVLRESRRLTMLPRREVWA